MDLKELRRKIDRIDSRILKLLNRRAGLTAKIGKLKARKSKGVYAPEREEVICGRLAKENKGPLSNKAIKAIFSEIMSGSRALEKRLRVSYLGPSATFTQQAALKKFGSEIEYIACHSITEVFTEIERERADFGVVPIENSIEGAVSHTLDMFVDSDLVICAEITLEIVHNLLANCKLDEIRTVYSNPQVIGQCRLWLEANLPRVKLVEVTSTSQAAAIASREKFAAAIASDLAAEKYKLKIEAPSIEDSAHNVTRFLVIGRTLAKPTKKDKTSIMFAVKDRVGALHGMLLPFKKHKISLTKIESRPSKKKAWEYYFFIDFKGHCREKRVKAALAELKKECTFFKILGSYPIGIE